MRRIIDRFGLFSSTISMPFLTIAFIVCGLVLLASRQVAIAQSIPNEAAGSMADWALAAHAEAMRVPVTVDSAAIPETIPTTIPVDSTNPDPTGEVETYNPTGPTDTSSNAFFESLGTNGRSCFSCHQPQDGWTITPNDATARFNATKGTDPVFVPFDGATCFNDNVATLAEKRKAYKLLLTKGLIRIALPIPSAGLQFEVSSVTDPYGCTSLTSPTTGMLSIYRRPLPATNLADKDSTLFESTIMWDGREPSLVQQAIDATEIHGQTGTPPSDTELAEILGFETGTYTAQLSHKAGKVTLTAAGASGGAMALQSQLFIPNNDPITNPGGFSDDVFDLYTPWESITGKTAAELLQESVARGQQIFNTLTFNISGVRGFNDVLGEPSVPGTCASCHNTENFGNRSVGGTMEIGIDNDIVLNTTGLPVFTLQCTAGPLSGQIFVTNDPGRALISGQCGDIGSFKVPSLRGLAARAPYFHNGSAATLVDVINHYNFIFNITPRFTTKQTTDLANFLETL